MYSQNIKNILIFYRDKHGMVLEDEILEVFADYLARITSTRPIPNFHEVVAEEEAGTIFFKILDNLCRVQEKHKENFEHLSELMKRILLKVNSGEDFSEIKDFIQRCFKEEKFKKIFKFGDGMQLRKCSNQEELFSFLNCIQKRVENYNSDEFSDILIKDLVKCMLRIHSKYCLRSLDVATQGSNVPVKFIHFYESPCSSKNEDFRGKPRASEYLNSYNSSDDEEELRAVNFDKTAHGLGSGIYGVAQLSEEMIDEQVVRESQFCIIEIPSPLCLIDKEADTYTEISKYLQRIANLVKSKQIESRSQGNKLTRIEAFNLILEEKKEELEAYAKIINLFSGVKIKKLSNEEIYAHLCQSIVHFFKDASSKEDENKENRVNRKKVVPMPINYFVESLAFKGVVSLQNDAFNRGLIAMNFEEDPILRNFAKIEVKSLGKKEIPSAGSRKSKEILTSHDPLPRNIEMGGSAFFKKRKVMPFKEHEVSALSTMNHFS